MTDVNRVAALVAASIFASISALGAPGCRDNHSSNQAAPATATAAHKPHELRIDYATYNLSSLVLKNKGWLEAELAKDDIAVRWVFSQGSNKANELLSSASADLASTAGAAALLARTNGVPLRIVYVYSKPEWTALVVTDSSPITQVADLKGKKVAATRGTDPFFFLLRSLKAAGLDQHDVELVHLQHSDGRLALQRGDVDAWAGLDPFMASAELREHARLLYRNIDFNTYGTLNVRDEFLASYPEVVQRVIAQYERARTWILANQHESAELLAAAGKIELDVATKQIGERTVLDRDVGIPGEPLRKALQAVVPILRSEKLVGADADPDKALGELLAPAAAQAVIR
jgi:sulfonate transport system substrate-binding protein